MTTSLRCPECNNRIIQKSQDGKVRIRTKIVSFVQDSAEVVCQKCGSDVSIGLLMADELKKSIDGMVNSRRKLILKLKKS